MDVELLQRVTDRFDEVLAGVGPERYEQPTPCADWTVAQLIDHVIAGNRRVVMLLAGVESAVATARLQELPRAPDRRADFRPSAAAQRAAFAAATPDVQVTTAAGGMSAERLLGMRTVDLLVHAWDLARAVGADERLAPELVAPVLAIVEPQAEWMAVSGVFGGGAAGAPPPLDEQERLLHLTGRRPRDRNPAARRTSSLLIVQVDVQVLPDRVDAFLAATGENAAASREEPGVVRFDVLADRADPAHIVLVEVYRDAAAAAAHKETAHYRRWRETVAALMARPRSSVQYVNVSPDDSGW